jgi:hypothetical protein
VTDFDDIRSDLDDLEGELENQRTQQEVGGPRRSQQLDDMLSTVQRLKERLRYLETKNDGDQRLAAVFDRLGQFTALAHARLEYMEETAGQRNGSAFPADPKVLAEGEWLRGMLAGPPTDDVAPQLFMRAPRPRVQRGLDQLAETLLRTTSAREVLKGHKGRRP